jgi:TPR repeat protein
VWENFYEELIAPMLHRYGCEGQADLETFYDLVVFAAESHDLCACQLAQVGEAMMQKGRVVDAVLGRTLLEDSAFLGHGRARVRVADMLSTGKWSRCDYEKANRLLVLVLHDMGSTCDDIAEASALLADNYLMGRGAVIDVKRALQLYESAYRLGLPEAALHLAAALEDPQNVGMFPLNRLEMAARYYELVKDEVPSSKSALAFLHLRGGWAGADEVYARCLLNEAFAEGCYFAHIYLELERRHHYVPSRELPS